MSKRLSGSFQSSSVLRLENILIGFPEFCWAVLDFKDYVELRLISKSMLSWLDFQNYVELIGFPGLCWVDWISRTMLSWLDFKDYVELIGFPGLCWVDWICKTMLSGFPGICWVDWISKIMFNWLDFHIMLSCIGFPEVFLSNVFQVSWVSFTLMAIVTGFNWFPLFSLNRHP